MSGMRILTVGLVGAVLLGSIWWVNDANKPTVEKCLMVGEPPNGHKPMNDSSAPRLKQTQMKIQAVLPGQVISLQTLPLSSAQSIDTGKQKLLIQVKAEKMDPQTLPDQYKAGLLQMKDQFFSSAPTYGAIQIEVFRNGLWVYGAEVVKDSKSGSGFYVQQDWRCEDAVRGSPRI